MIVNLQKKFLNDLRSWKDIPVEKITFADNGNVLKMPEIISMVTGYVTIHNRISSNQIEISEVRISHEDGFQGYYISDWEVRGRSLANEKEQTRRKGTYIRDEKEA